MKSNLTPTPRRGFTIMTTVVAIGVIAVLMSIFMLVFVPARDQIRASLAKENVDAISAILRSEMTTLRKNERAGSSDTSSSSTKYLSGFDKAFYWFLRSKKPSTSIVIFSYRADLSRAARVDGSFPPVDVSKNVAASQSELVTMACPMDDKLHTKAIRNAVGPVFLVKMTQCRQKDNGEFVLSDKPGIIAGAQNPSSYISSPDTQDAYGSVVFYRADFYIMKPSDPSRYKRVSWAKLGRPIFSVNLSFSR